MSTNENKDKKETFILIPLRSLTQVWERHWTFRDLFDIGFLISASKTKQLSVDEWVEILNYYGMLANIRRFTPSQGCWVDQQIMDAAELVFMEDRFIASRSLQDYCMNNKDNIVDIWCKIAIVCRYLNMDIKESFDILYNGLRKLNFCREQDGEEPCSNTYFEKPPYILVSRSVIKSFIRLENYCSDMDKARRLMFLGIASIIGRNKLSSTTSDLIKARMFGFLTPKDLQDYYNAPEHESFRALYDKYTTRRRYDYMLKDLKIDGLIGEVPYKRRTVVSMKVKNDLELLNAVSNNNKSRQRQQLTENLRKAKEQFKMLNKEKPA